MTTRGGDRPVDGRQTDPRPGVLGREARLQRAGQHRGCHPRAVVVHAHRDRGARGCRGVAPAGVEGDAARAGQGVPGVQQQVQHRLLELGPVGGHQAGRPGRLPADRRRGDDTADQAHDQLERVAHVERLPGVGGPGAGFQQPVHDVDAPLGRDADALQVSRHRAGRAELAGRDRGVVQDDAEEVAEVVRDAAGEPAQALEALRLGEAGDEHRSFVLGPELFGVALAFSQRGFGGPVPRFALSALGDVDERHHDPGRERQRVVEHRSGGDGDPDVGPVAAHHPQHSGGLGLRGAQRDHGRPLVVGQRRAVLVRDRPLPLGVEGAAARDQVRRPAEDPRRGGVRRDDAVRPVLEDHALFEVFEEGLVVSVVVRRPILGKDHSGHPGPRAPAASRYCPAPRPPRTAGARGSGRLGITH